MNDTVWTRLRERAVIAVEGADARHLLQNLITCDLDKVAACGAAYGALLTPQGKVQFDFIIFVTDVAFLFDVPKILAKSFVQRLGMYRLRSAVEIEDRSEKYDVVAIWGGGPELPVAIAAAEDPRLRELGRRAIVAAGSDLSPMGAEVGLAAYETHRIGLAVPEGGPDFAYGETFPHDADLDQLGGVAFDKGCFVGQEVVSRIEHRGTARRRIISVRTNGRLEPAADILVGDQVIGTIGSVSGEIGLAMVRLDRAASATKTGKVPTAAAKPVELTIPNWARFGWPAPPSDDRDRQQ